MSPETIRHRALECMRLAQDIDDPDHRSLLLDMAHSWADLANAADRFQLMAETGGEGHWASFRMASAKC